MRRFGERRQERISRTITVIQIFLSQRRRSFIAFVISKRTFWKRLLETDVSPKRGTGTSTIPLNRYCIGHVTFSFLRPNRRSPVFNETVFRRATRFSYGNGSVFFPNRFPSKRFEEFYICTFRDTIRKRFREGTMRNKLKATPR